MPRKLSLYRLEKGDIAIASTDAASLHHGLRQGAAIYMLDLTTHRQPPGDTAHFQSACTQQATDVMCGGFALDRVVGREDDFLDYEAPRPLPRVQGLVIDAKSKEPIGNAIVDVIATCDDAFIAERGLVKGSMRLLTTAEADDLYAAMGPARETSGGSAANSMAGVAALGGRAAFIGQVADDQLGTVFAHDIRAAGVDFDTPVRSGQPTTARCLICPAAITMATRK